MKMIPLFFFLFFPSLSQAGEEIRIRLPEDMGTLDWNYGEVNPEVVNLLMEGLFRTDKNGLVKPGLASSYVWNKNKTKLTVGLRGAQWSDGEKLCGSHFVDSWNRLLSKEFASPYAHYAHGLKSFRSPDCRKLEIEFHRPSPEALAYLSHYVFFPWRKDQKAEGFTKGEGLLVNGFYRLEKWERDKKIKLIPLGKGKTPITFLVVPEDSTAQAMFERGDLDVIKSLPVLLRSEKTKNPKIFSTFVSFYFGINQKKVPDQNLRWALSESLDRKSLARVFGQEYEGTDSWVNQKLLAAKRKPQKVNWEAAKTAVKNANLILRVYQKGINRTLAEWAQGEWEKKLGYRIPIEVQEGKVYWKEITQDSAPLFLSGVTAPYAHPKAFLQEFLSTSTANWTNWSSSDYDTAVNSQNYPKALDILRESGVVIPLFHRNTALNLSEKAKDLRLNPLGILILP